MTTSARRRQQVSAALSHYLGAPGDEAFSERKLGRDFGMEPLDLVLFVMAFEETDGLAFPFEELEHAITAGQLVELLAGWLSEYDYAERLADEDDRFGKESGLWAATHEPPARKTR